MAVFGKMVRDVIDLVYPKTCLACKTKLEHRACVDSVVCAGCWAGIKKNQPPFCRTCGRHLEAPEAASGHTCSRCSRRQVHFDRAFSPCLYEGILKGLIHEFKYQGKDYLGKSLSRLLIEFIQEYNVPMQYIDTIIPMPLHPAKLREREFNQAEVLSRHVAAAFDKTMFPRALRRHRYTRPQVEMDQEQERLLNVQGSFSPDKKIDIRGKNILLIDDVLTTGATSSEGARALKQAGAAMVLVLTLAN
jgi:ComF family protein